MKSLATRVLVQPYSQADSHSQRKSGRQTKPNSLLLFSQATTEDVNSKPTTASQQLQQHQAQQEIQQRNKQKRKGAHASVQQHTHVDYEDAENDSQHRNESNSQDSEPQRMSYKHPINSLNLQDFDQEGFQAVAAAHMKDMKEQNMKSKSRQEQLQNTKSVQKYRRKSEQQQQQVGAPIKMVRRVSAQVDTFPPSAQASSSLLDSQKAAAGPNKGDNLIDLFLAFANQEKDVLNKSKADPVALPSKLYSQQQVINDKAGETQEQLPRKKMKLSEQMLLKKPMMKSKTIPTQQIARAHASTDSLVLFFNSETERQVRVEYRCSGDKMKAAAAAAAATAASAANKHEVSISQHLELNSLEKLVLKKKKRSEAEGKGSGAGDKVVSHHFGTFKDLSLRFKNLKNSFKPSILTD